MNAEKFWKDVLQQNRDILADWFRPETAVLWEPMAVPVAARVSAAALAAMGAT